MTGRPTTIAVDVMGGDNGPSVLVAGVAAASLDRSHNGVSVLVGDEQVIRAELGKHKHDAARIAVRHASQTMEMSDKPSDVYRRKPDSSVAVAAKLVRDGEADGFISVGNTGAAMASAVFALRTIPGIDRPAIATPMPSPTGPVVLLDAGATVDCTARQVLQFAVMGAVYARVVLGKDHPTVGLLSNGEESSKGNELTKEAHVLLREHVSGFHGNVEGGDVFRGTVDVVACDGFVGNIVLKAGEGMAKMILDQLKVELTRNSMTSLLAVPLKGAFRRLRAGLDYREFGGAPLLGVNGVCIIGHGRSDARAMANAVRVANASVGHDLVQGIREAAAALPGVQRPNGDSVARAGAS